MTTKKIKITMSERRPLSIDPEAWPIIAESRWYNGEHEFQANTIRQVKVREHEDGRRIVYGFQDAGGGGQAIGTRNPAGGFLLHAGAPPDETIRAIRRVAGIIDDDALGEECIADLPAEDLDAEPAATDASDGASDDDIRLPRDGARRLLDTMDRIVANKGVGIDPRYAEELRMIADELRSVLE
jgi:hypothetical protein